MGRSGRSSFEPDARTGDRAVEARRWAWFFTVTAALLFLVSVLKGIRMPNAWAATHMTFNYSHGFVRRGLVGELLRLVGGGRLYRYGSLACLAFAFAAVGAVALVLAIRRTSSTLRDGDQAFRAAVLVVAASPAVVFLAHIVGYFDHLGIAFASGLLLLWRRVRSDYVAACSLAVVGVLFALIHESLVLMFVPALTFGLLCRIVASGSGQNQTEVGHSSRTPAARVAAFVAALGAAAVAFVATTAVSATGTKPAATIQALQISTAPLVDFPLRGDAFDVLSRSMKENAFKLMPYHWSFAANRRYLVRSLVAALPGLAFLLWCGIRRIRRVPFSTFGRRTLLVLFPLVSLGPLSLNVLGWDSARWSAAAILASFTSVTALYLFGPSPHPPPSSLSSPPRDSALPLTCTLAAAAIVLGLSTNYPDFLFDGYVVQWFPFDAQLESFFGLLMNGEKFIPRN